MTDPLESLERQLRRLRPRAPSATLREGIGRQLADNADTTAHTRPAPSRDRSASNLAPPPATTAALSAWWVTVGAAAACLMIAALSQLPQPAPDPPADAPIAVTPAPTPSPIPAGAHPMTVLALQQALRQSPEALQQALDDYGRRSANGSAAAAPPPRAFMKPAAVQHPFNGTKVNFLPAEIAAQLCQARQSRPDAT